MESIPYDKRPGKIWFNGEPVNWSDVKIHVFPELIVSDTDVETIKRCSIMYRDKETL